MVPRAGIEPATRGFSSHPPAREINRLRGIFLSNPLRKIKHLRGDCQTGFRAIRGKEKPSRGRPPTSTAHSKSLS